MAQQTSVTPSVPTANLREGNFTGMSTIYDPTTQTVIQPTL